MQSPTRKQKQDFTDHAHSDSLEVATDWIKENMTPDEVFGKDELKEWLQNNKTPEDVFDADRLADWAKENDYVLTD